METYQETARAMGREPYADAEFDTAQKIRDQLISANGDFKSRSGWARRYVGGTRFENLQEEAGLDKWKNDYKWASQNIHTTFRELRGLLAMGEAAEDGLLVGLVGPSDSGFAQAGPLLGERSLPNDIRLYDLLYR